MKAGIKGKVIACGLGLAVAASLAATPALARMAGVGCIGGSNLSACPAGIACATAGVDSGSALSTNDGSGDSTRPKHDDCQYSDCREECPQSNAASDEETGACEDGRGDCLTFADEDGDGLCDNTCKVGHEDCGDSGNRAYEHDGNHGREHGYGNC